MQVLNPFFQVLATRRHGLVGFARVMDPTNTAQTD